MIWLFFALISVIAVSLSSLFQRSLMKEEKSDPILSSIIFQFFLVVMTGSFALYKGFVFPPIKTFGGNILLSGLLYAVGTIFGFKAAQKLGAGEMSIISAVGAIVPIIFAISFLHESFGWIKLLGTICIVGAIIFLYKGQRFKLNQGVLYALGVTIFYGLGVVNDTNIIHHYNAISYTLVACFIPWLILSISQPKAYLRLKQFVHWRIMKQMVLLTFFYSISAITYFLALEQGAHASQMLPIARSTIIVTVLLAAVFLQERDHLVKKIISAVIVTIGVFWLV